MDILLVRPVLDSLNEGKVIRKCVTIAMKVVGVLFALLGLILVIEILKASFELPTEGTLGGVLLALLFAAGAAVVVQILYYHAEQVKTLGESQYTVIPIVAILLRALGEAYAAMAAAIGVGGCLFIWLAKTSPVGLIGGMGLLTPGYLGEMSFIGGIFFLVYTLVAGFAALMLSYFFAEATVVLVDIAKNTRGLHGQRAA